MGLLGALVNLFVPGLTQLLHLDLLKAVFIWAGLGVFVFFAGAIPVLGPILTSYSVSVPVLGKLTLAALIFHLWQLSDAYSY